MNTPDALPDLVTDVQLELHVPDFVATKEFYGSLGFEVVWNKTGADNYLVMRRGHSVLNFYGGNESVYEHDYFGRFPKTSPRGYAVEIIIPIDDIQSFYQDFAAMHEEHVVSELNDRYSHLDFRASDPFGYYLRFVERYNWVDGRDKNGVPLA